MNLITQYGLRILVLMLGLGLGVILYIAEFAIGFPLYVCAGAKQSGYVRQ